MRRVIIAMLLMTAVYGNAQGTSGSGFPSVACSENIAGQSYLDTTNNLNYKCVNIPVAGYIWQLGNSPLQPVVNAPSGLCTNGFPSQQVISTGAVYTCNNGTWGLINAGASSAVSATNPGPVSNTIIPLTITSTQGSSLPSFQQIEYETLFQGSVPDTVYWTGWSPSGSHEPTTMQGTMGTSAEYNYCPVGQTYCQSEYHIVSQPPTTASRNSAVRWLTGYQRYDTGYVNLGFYADVIGFDNPNDSTAQQLWQLQSGIFTSNNSTDNASVPMFQVARNSGIGGSALLSFYKNEDSWRFDPNFETLGNTAIGAAVYSGAKLYIYNGSSSVVPIWITSATLASGNYVHLEDGNGNLFNIGLNGQIASRASTAIVSASSITPTAPFFHVTGTAAIATITAPTACTTSGMMCQITMIPDGAFTTTNAGNIAIASTAVVSKPLIMTYDPATSKWYPSY